MKKTLSIIAALCLGINGFAQVPFAQNFTVVTTGALSTAPPSGWSSSTTASVTPVIEWKFGDATAASSDYFTPPAHGVFAVLNSDSAGDATTSTYTQTLCDAWLKTPVITGIPAGTYLSFDYYFQHASCITYGGNSSPSLPYEIFVVHISTNGGSTWSVLDSVPGITTNAWSTQHINLAAYSGMNIILGFEYNNGSTWMAGAAFTNLNVYVPATNSLEYYTISPVAGTPASYVLAGTNQTITNQVVNIGSSPITTFTATYTDGTNTYTTVPTGLNIAPFDTATFSYTTPYNTTLGAHNIKSWVKLTGDVTHTDDTLTTVLTGASFLPTHQMVVEEGAGCWCGWCPRGAVFMDSMRVVHPNDVSLISVRDKTGGTDPMAVTVYDNGFAALLSGFPSIMPDRKEVLDPSQIFDGYADHAGDFAFADLTLSASITGTTLTATTTTKPAVSLNGTYQLALVLTEDSVHNTASTYAQHNYYSSTTDNLPLVGAGHNWQTSANPVPASLMWYNYVARSITSSFTGVPSSLPASMTAGTTYNYTFSGVSTSTWVQTRLTAILLLIDVTSGTILNSKSVHPTIATTGITKIGSNINDVSVYPNPSSSNFNVNIDLAKSQKTTVVLTNVMGQAVYTKGFEFNTGSNLINISADQLASGMYTLSVISETGTHQTKISVVK